MLINKAFTGHDIVGGGYDSGSDTIFLTMQGQFEQLWFDAGEPEDPITLLIDGAKPNRANRWTTTQLDRDWVISFEDFPGPTWYWRLILDPPGATIDILDNFKTERVTNRINQFED